MSTLRREVEVRRKLEIMGVYYSDGSGGFYEADEDVRGLLDEIEALRQRVAELEAERSMITYIATETSQHPDVLKHVIEDALTEVRSKRDGGRDAI